ncbi:hypothetical protein Tcan_01565 [Toxocara canis]|uniref:Uncharacterized protein n=1 Tax=Toxocara canis TaxID=6265 RepID=A0A0B2V3N8_TOXCA|nr:hypothetical protein Tcan_01565 [Toxocara canis]
MHITVEFVVHEVVPLVFQRGPARCALEAFGVQRTIERSTHHSSSTETVMVISIHLPLTTLLLALCTLQCCKTFFLINNRPFGKRSYDETFDSDTDLHETGIDRSTRSLSTLASMHPGLSNLIIEFFEARNDSMRRGIRNVPRIRSSYRQGGTIMLG